MTLSENLTNLSQQLTSFSDKVTGVAKTVAIIKWQMNTVFLVAIGFAGVS